MNELRVNSTKLENEGSFIHKWIDSFGCWNEIEYKTIIQDGKKVEIRHGFTRVWGKRWGHEGYILLMETPWKNGRKHGVETLLGSRGEILSEIHYKNGKRDGLYLIRYDDGTPSEMVTFKNGVRHGISKIWGIRGNLIESVVYNNGVISGE